MAKKDHETDEDLDFFHSQMKNVKPLKKKIHKVNIKKVSIKDLTTSQKVLKDIKPSFPFSDHLRETVTSETTLNFVRSGIQYRQLHRLHMGEIRPTATLDLHGATVSEARELLSQFLSFCLTNGHRCVRIIHGKGKLDLDPPVLKNHINNWLPQYPDVLAFCSAKQKDGGAGAVYVLLKRMIRK